MNNQNDEWDESILDIEDYQAERALQNAALDAMRRARTFGTEYVIWEDGKVKAVKPKDTFPYEKVGLENLERLNRKIAELEGQSTGAAALNEEPPQKS